MDTTIRSYEVDLYEARVVAALRGYRAYAVSAMIYVNDPAGEEDGRYVQSMIGAIGRYCRRLVQATQEEPIALEIRSDAVALRLSGSLEDLLQQIYLLREGGLSRVQQWYRQRQQPMSIYAI